MNAQRYADWQKKSLEKQTQIYTKHMSAIHLPGQERQKEMKRDQDNKEQLRTQMTHQLVEQQKAQQMEIRKNYQDILSSQIAQHDMEKNLENE